MRMAMVVTKREITEVLRDFNLLFPMIVLPTLIALIAGVAVLGSNRGPVNFMAEMIGAAALNQLPESQLRILVNLDLRDQEAVIRVVLNALMIPLFWVTPVALTSTVAADSFVGEKERNTIEPLLAAPISDGQLFLAKLATAVIPAVLGTWVGMMIFGAFIYNAPSRYVPRFILLDPDWQLSALVIVPLMAVLAAAIAALISTRVATYRSAYQLNSLVVLPIILMLVPQTIVLFLFTPRALVYIGAFILFVDAGLIWLAMRFFDRERILRGRS